MLPSLPPLLPLLPLRGRVLLPLSVLRVVLASPRSLALVEANLWGRRERGDIFVGVVPLIKNKDGTETMHNCGTARPRPVRAHPWRGELW